MIGVIGLGRTGLPLATNLIVRALIDHGLLVELWGFDRRTDQLEDRSGFLAAAALGDPRLALDWYYGAELGFTLGSPLTRRAEREAELGAVVPVEREPRIAERRSG